MPVGAIIGAAAGLGSSLIASSSAKKAAKAQAKASQQAQDTQLRMYEMMRGDLAPWVGTGRNANAGIADMYGIGPAGGEAFSPAALEAFKRAPDYKVAMDAGTHALDSSAAAKGGLLSGGHLRELTRFAEDNASSRWRDYMDRLGKISGVGETAAAGQGAGALSTGSNIANLQTGAGDAKAAGIVGSGNAFSEGLQSLGNLAAYKLNPSSYGTVNPFYG